MPRPGIRVACDGGRIVASHLIAESIRVHLPAWIRAETRDHSQTDFDAMRVVATCTRLSATHVRLEAE